VLAYGADNVSDSPSSRVAAASITARCSACLRAVMSMMVPIMPEGSPPWPRSVALNMMMWRLPPSRPTTSIS
jgi:hypothetical protein